MMFTESDPRETGIELRIYKRGLECRLPKFSCGQQIQFRRAERPGVRASGRPGDRPSARALGIAQRHPNLDSRDAPTNDVTCEKCSVPWKRSPVTFDPGPLAGIASVARGPRTEVRNRTSPSGRPGRPGRLATLTPAGGTWRWVLQVLPSCPLELATHRLLLSSSRWRKLAVHSTSYCTAFDQISFRRPCSLPDYSDLCVVMH